MKRIIRLTESDLVKLVKKVMNEQLMNYAQKKVIQSPSELLMSETDFNKKIGVKELPNCFKNTNQFEQGGIFPTELEFILKQTGWPISNDGVRRSLNWGLSGDIPGPLGGGSMVKSPLKNRVVQKDGLWYPAVEQLRVLYNKKAMMYGLGETVSNPKFNEFKQELENCYKTWIDCMNS
jgi:hypothetical protein